MKTKTAKMIRTNSPAAIVAGAVLFSAVTLGATLPQGDTVNAYCRWGQSSGAGGPATSYVVNWMYRIMSASPDTPLQDLKPQKETQYLADTATVTLPPLGDSVLVVCTVTPKRRGLTGNSMSAQRYFGRPDSRPDAVPFVTVDTL
jgi:hypothetical protein